MDALTNNPSYLEFLEGKDEYSLYKIPIDLESLLQISFMCKLKYMFASKFIPKNLFFFSVRSMISLPRPDRRLEYFLSTEKYFMVTLGVFTLFLFTFSQWFIVSKFLLIKLEKFSTYILLKLHVKALSSSKRVNLNKFEHFGKSLINIRNKSGRIKHWTLGTPKFNWTELSYTHSMIQLV